MCRDTTEADLKQRREIGAGGTIRHVNQAVVNAAIHGRVLVLEGLEKVERNVLPIRRWASMSSEPHASSMCVGTSGLK